MVLLTLVIPIAAACSALLHIRAEYMGPRWQVYLFKPVTTSLLLLLAGVTARTQGPQYQLAVVIGLACSLVGDVMLMLPSDRFVVGLASFLLAHLAYVFAFSTGVGMTSSPALLLPFAAMAGVLLRLLWAGLGKLRIPVLLYTGAILLMVWRAWARHQALPGSSALLAAAGALFFMVSDSLLALNRFYRPYRLAQAAIMTTYFAAQLLIALSVGAA